MNREFPTDGPIKAAVRLARGSLVVQAEDRSSVEVTVAAGDDSAKTRRAVEETSVNFTGRSLTVTAPNARGLINRGANLDVVIRVPSGSQLGVATAKASVATSGRLKKIEIATALSPVTITVPAGTSVHLDQAKLAGHVGFEGDVSLASSAGDADMTIEVAAVRSRILIIGQSAQ